MRIRGNMVSLTIHGMIHIEFLHFLEKKSFFLTNLQDEIVEIRPNNGRFLKHYLS